MDTVFIKGQNMKLSIVTTLYMSQDNIIEFYERITKEAQKITENYEIIFVDDGSPDNSLGITISLSENDERIKIIELSRNFGHHKAMMTGLNHSQGDLVFLIDVDLEEEPEILGSFYQKIQNETNEIDVLYGVQKSRKGGWFEKISGQFFYSAFNYLTDLDMTKNQVTARLMTKTYVKALVLHKENEIFIGGLWHITGFRQKSVIIEKHSTSETTYSLTKKLVLLENAVTSFSNKPLKIIFHTGLLISLVAIVYIIYLSLMKFFLDIPVDGWTSIISSIWLLGGLIIFFIGVIGIYLSKIYTESKERPYTIIRKVYQSNKMDMK